MKQGRIQKINWREYQTNKFHFAPLLGAAECGAYALYSITKQKYSNIVKLGDKGHWSNKVMFKYLNNLGYKVIPITINNVVESYSINTLSKRPNLNVRNVILLDQKCFREENTWSVMYGNMIAHSGEIEVVHPLEFINCPIEAAYLIWHNKWR
jgi:hypothetical protein